MAVYYIIINIGTFARAATILYLLLGTDSSNRYHNHHPNKVLTAEVRAFFIDKNTE
jgi:hypothetical protein